MDHALSRLRLGANGAIATHITGTPRRCRLHPMRISAPVVKKQPTILSLASGQTRNGTLVCRFRSPYSAISHQDFVHPPNCMPTMNVRLALATAIWSALVAGGVYAMLDYEMTPSASGQPPSTWPADVSLAPPSDRPTLVMFAHPHCPCTRASIRELSLLMANAVDSVQAYVIFPQPSAKLAAWTETDIWESAQRIPGVHVVADEGERLTRRFAMQTSGETLLYDQHGALQFHGGVTASRGHQGENVGRTSLLSFIQQRRSTTSSTLVFGCPLSEHSTNTSIEE